MPLPNALAMYLAKDNIILAIGALKANQFLSIRRAAKAFNVPKSTQTCPQPSIIWLFD